MTGIQHIRQPDAKHNRWVMKLIITALLLSLSIGTTVPTQLALAMPQTMPQENSFVNEHVNVSADPQESSFVSERVNVAGGDAPSVASPSDAAPSYASPTGVSPSDVPRSDIPPSDASRSDMPPSDASHDDAPRSILNGTTPVIPKRGLSVGLSAQAAPVTGITSEDSSHRLVHAWGSSKPSNGEFSSVSGQPIYYVGNTIAYCVRDGLPYFHEGLSFTGSEDDAIDYLGQELLTKMALAQDYVWNKDEYRTPDGRKLANDAERFAVTQCVFRQLCHHYGRVSAWGKAWHNFLVGCTWNSSEDKWNQDGRSLTGITAYGHLSDSMKPVFDYIEENVDSYVGHGQLFGYSAMDTNQIVAGVFWLEPTTGDASLKKTSSNTSISQDNSCYSLAGAQYGIYKSKADAQSNSNAVGTLTTKASGESNTLKKLKLGTYYAKEIKAPAGFLTDNTIHTVTVEPGENVFEVADEPAVDTVSVMARKVDAELNRATAQGSATFAGTRFTVRYYDGYYANTSQLPTTPKRTWVLQTDAKGEATLSSASKVSGDNLYMQNGSAVIPLGTITVQETAAPAGYLLDNGQGGAPELFILQIKQNGTGARVTGAYKAPTSSDTVIRGGLVVGKRDREYEDYVPLGAATLANAAFEITSENPNPVLVDGTEYTKGQVVKTIRTVLEEDGRYVARTAAKSLPYGTYTVRESETSQGYLLDDTSKAWVQTITISEDGQVVDLTEANDAVSNQVIRGDFSLSKINGESSERLAHIPFRIESVTTGEAHIALTDENGMLSTAADWMPHTTSTNANDSALNEYGSVNEQLLTTEAGIWFCGRSDAPAYPQENLGALPYDTYRVTELRTSANEGLSLASFTITISRNARELDLGTVDDNAGPAIGTTLATEDDLHTVPAETTVTLIDTVAYENLTAGVQYTMAGALHVVNAKGEDTGVIASSATEFLPELSSGTVKVIFQINTADLQGSSLVAFERLMPGKVDAETAFDDNAATAHETDSTEQTTNNASAPLATHEDLSDEGQTVRVLEIGTTLTDTQTGTHTAATAETIELVDTVAYKGLTPGVSYTMTGTLHVRDHDGNDAGVAKDTSGNAIMSSQSFTPESAEGSVNVHFTFPSSTVQGQTLVAYEELDRTGRTVAVHADIANEHQTVSVPEAPTPQNKKEKTPEKGKKQAKKTTKSGTVPKTGDNNRRIGWIASLVLIAGLVAIFSLKQATTAPRKTVAIPRHSATALRKSVPNSRKAATAPRTPVPNSRKAATAPRTTVRTPRKP